MSDYHQRHYTSSFSKTTDDQSASKTSCCTRMLQILAFLTLITSCGFIVKLNIEFNQERVNLIKGYVKLHDDWIAPLNGYQYKLIRSSLPWDEARKYCREKHGADLASLGVQSIKIRQILMREFDYNLNVWIGLNDLSHEGTWKWISLVGLWDGHYATNDFSLWYRDPPSNSSSYNDCAALKPSSAYAFPTTCSSAFHFLCEKQYN